MPRRKKETEKHRQTKRAGSPTVTEGVKVLITREYVHIRRGKFKGKGLLKALMAEKKNECEL